MALPPLEQRLEHRLFPRDQRENEQRRHEQLEIFRRQTERQRNGEARLVRNAAEYHRRGRADTPKAFEQAQADDDRSQPQHNHASSHLLVGRALRLRDDRTGKRRKPVADGKTRDFTLPGIAGEHGYKPRVVARCAEQQPALGAQKRVQQNFADDHERKTHHKLADVEAADGFRYQRRGKRRENRGLAEERSHAVSAVEQKQDDEVHREQRREHQNSAEQRTNLQLNVQNPCDTAKARAREKRREQAEPRVYAVENQHARKDRPQRHGAVHGQVGEVENAVGQVNAKGEERVHQPLFERYLQNVENNFHSS
ncbi:hypothetical protein SDC9_149337 [bioreactor metagenome]|uniref:Uncharacterized protein n=1 Tax=bioreactor metagenome TaxID=1076179 RepID=A0A645EN98_9ZZZZ